jgi:hypothetical protein
MGFKEIISKIGEKQRERKALLRQVDDEFRVQKMVEDRQKSANERELERFMKEEREDMIKQHLEIMRKKRDKEIKFGHNPLDTPNITNHVDWEVLKERNMFMNNGNIFMNQEFIHKNNPNLFRGRRGF